MGNVLDTSDSGTLLLSLARNIPGAFYRCSLDHDWTMHLIGEEIERITGYPADDFIDSRVRSYGSLIHADDRERVERDVWAAVEADRQFELEYRVITASGEERWVLERGCAVQGHEREWLDGIIFDITDRRRFEQAARRAEADAAVAREVAESRRRVIVAADEARRQIERDLHDGAQQSFVCSLMTLRAARARLADNPDEAAALLAATQDHLDRGLGELRDLAHGIHPSLLTTRGVAAAVDELGARTPVPVTVAGELRSRLPDEIEAALYFSVAEAITNAAKHASASEITVELGCDDRGVWVEIADDGVGGASPADGSGLRGLHDRLAAVGGAVEITSRPGAGTRVLARIPPAA